MDFLDFPGSFRKTKCFCTHECFNSVNIMFNPKFYPKLLLKSIQSTKDKYQSILILNHEPAVKILVKKFCYDSNKNKKILDTKFSTAAVATIIFKKLSWKNVKFSDGLLDGFIKPKDFY